MTKTVTGLFDDYSDATAAVDQLKAAGISDSDISIVSNNADGRHKGDNDVAEDAGTGAGIGAAVGGVGQVTGGEHDALVVAVASAVGQLGGELLG